jgi:DNA-binding HxlR family transcriptional regulator
MTKLVEEAVLSGVMASAAPDLGVRTPGDETKPHADRANANGADTHCGCGDAQPPGDNARKSHDPGAPKLERFLCPVDEAARIVGQKWTLQIVHHLLDGRSRRFCELQEALGRVNPSTLSSRLKMLEEAGLVSRSQISDIPPHVEYRLTDMGAELRGVINEITRWSNAHLCTPQRKSARAVQADPAPHSKARHTSLRSTP